MVLSSVWVAITLILTALSNSTLHILLIMQLP